MFTICNVFWNSKLLLLVLQLNKAIAENYTSHKGIIFALYFFLKRVYTSFPTFFSLELDFKQNHKFWLYFCLIQLILEENHMAS